MAASKTNMKANIKSAFLAEYTGTPSAEQTTAIDNIAGKIADEVAQFVDDYVKTSNLSHVLAGYNAFVVTGDITNNGTNIE